jgi:hypothetical protein
MYPNKVIHRSYPQAFDLRFYPIRFISYPQELSTGEGLLVDKFRHAVPTCGFVDTIDTCAIVQPRTRGRLRIANAVCLAMLAGLLLSPIAANADSKGVTHKQISIDLLKLYAHSRIVNYKQFQCFNAIITKESRWNVSARNGSHYGLGQMRSTYYRNLDGYRMIDATLKYIAHRYGSPCKALAYHGKHGWY